jgi:hypothetical protein
MKYLIILLRAIFAPLAVLLIALGLGLMFVWRPFAVLALVGYKMLGKELVFG